MSATTTDLSLYLGDKSVLADCKLMKVKPAKVGPRHDPVSHAAFYKAIRESLRDNAIDVRQVVHALNKDGSVYFGIAEVDTIMQGFTHVIAWRSMHSQRKGGALYCGAAFNGNVCLTLESKLKGRQTLGFANRIQEHVEIALQEVGVASEQHQASFIRFNRTTLSDADASCAIVDMIRYGIVSPSKAGLVIDEWDRPTHDDCKSKRNMWRLLNACAMSYRPMSSTDSINTLIDRSPLLISFCKDMVMNKL